MSNDLKLLALHVVFYCRGLALHNGELLFTVEIGNDCVFVP